MDRSTRQYVIAGIVFLLVGGVCAFNAVMQGVWDREEAARKAFLEARRQEELASAPSAASEPPKSVFDVPPDTGPANAPVHVVVYFNSTNPCLEDVVKAVSTAVAVYGDLLRIDYRDTLDPEIQTEADGKQIGCESAIYFNGENVRRAQPGEIAGLKRFQGPPGDGNYSVCDIYGAINYLLEDAGIKPPPEALANATPDYPKY